MAMQTPYTRRIGNQPQDRPALTGYLDRIPPERVCKIQLKQGDIFRRDITLTASYDLEIAAVKVVGVSDPYVEVVDLSSISVFSMTLRV